MLMRSILLLTLLGGLATNTSAQDTKVGKPEPTPPSSSKAAAADDEQAVYALGVSLRRVLAPLDLSPAELEILERGLEDAANGKPEIAPEDVGPQVTALGRARAPRALEKEKARSAAYLEKAEKETSAVKTPSGLVFFDVKPGTGEPPPATATVKAKYRGTLVEGLEFESSGKADEPAKLRLSEVIPCLREGVQKMKVGGKARLVCPPTIAHGDRGRPNIPGGAALIFDVELIEIVKAPPPAAPQPAPLKQPPTSKPDSSH